MNDITIKFLGHTTVLITTGGLKMIFDPNFANKHFLLKRLDLPVIDSGELHQVNAIFISNAHHNRLHPKSFKYFKQTAQMILPLGLGHHVNTFFHFRLSELKAGAQTTIGDCRVTGVKSLHRAYRSNVFVQKPALHYLLHLGDKTIFYCSDTSYDGSFFFDVGKDQKIDLAILPVDHISPDLVAKKRFMNTRNALQAIQDMGAPKMIPYAFGAFNFASRKADKIVAQLKKDAEQLNLLDRIHVLAPGEEMVL